MREAGIRPLLLKGPSIAAWLYRDGARSPLRRLRSPGGPGPIGRPGTSFGSSDFAPLCVAGYVHTWHSGTPRHGGVALDSIVDLHRSLIGISAPPDTVWEELPADTDTLRVGGIDVEVLRVPARALHVALHAAEHGADLPHPLEDLARALRVADDDVWREAAELARRIDALPAFAAGLRFDPDGARLAERLELPGSVRLPSRYAPDPTYPSRSRSRTSRASSRFALALASCSGRSFPRPATSATGQRRA